MRRILAAAVAASLSITGMFASPTVASATTGTTWDIQAGSSAPGPFPPIGGGNRFYPESIAIHSGDSVRFTPIGPHTVTFNRPPVNVFFLFPPSGNPNITSPNQQANSGFIGAAPGQTYTLTFNLAPGRYTVICGLHLGMSETIDVRAAGEPLPKTHDEVVAQAQREVTRDLDRLADIAARAGENDEDNDEQSDDDRDGSPTVFVGMGTRRVSVLRFFPAAITIHRGQTVTFLKTKDPTEPHTVTFPDEDTSLNEVQQLLPVGGNVYNGTGRVSSGWLSTKAQYAFYHLSPDCCAGPPFFAPGFNPPTTTFKVKFTAAGTWDYICILHDPVGMVGKVVVLP